MLGGPRERSGFPPPSGRVTPPLCGLVLLRRSQADVRAALADLRRTRAASTCNHYRQALFSLYRALDGRAATNPVRDVEPFASPAPEARGLSYDAIRRILAAMVGSGKRHREGAATCLGAQLH